MIFFHESDILIFYSHIIPDRYYSLPSARQFLIIEAIDPP